MPSTWVIASVGLKSDAAGHPEVNTQFSLRTSTLGVIPLPNLLTGR